MSKPSRLEMIRVILATIPEDVGRLPERSDDIDREERAGFAIDLTGQGLLFPLANTTCQSEK